MRTQDNDCAQKNRHGNCTPRIATSPVAHLRQTKPKTINAKDDFLVTPHRGHGAAGGRPDPDCSVIPDSAASGSPDDVVDDGGQPLAPVTPTPAPAVTPRPLPIAAPGPPGNATPPKPIADDGNGVDVDTAAANGSLGVPPLVENGLGPKSGKSENDGGDGVGNDNDDGPVANGNDDDDDDGPVA